MAYITQAVFNKLCNTSYVAQADIPFDLFDEINFRFGVNKVLSDYEYNILSNYIKINSIAVNNDAEVRYLPPRIDTFSYVFEPIGAYKYHLFDNCSYLHNDFSNFVIPIEVKSKGSNLVKLYREWFISLGFDKVSGNENEIVAHITRAYNNLFSPKHDLTKLNEDYKLIVYIENSTYVTENRYFSFAEIYKEIISCIKDYLVRFPSSNTNLKKLMSISYMEYSSQDILETKVSELTSNVFIKNYGYKKLIADFRFANYIKRKILKKLKTYINWRYGFVMNNLSKTVLESYGLECCTACLKRFNSLD